MASVRLLCAGGEFVWEGEGRFRLIERFIRLSGEKLSGGFTNCVWEKITGSGNGYVGLGSIMLRGIYNHKIE